jgi:hypothetical protein
MKCDIVKECDWSTRTGSLRSDANYFRRRVCRRAGGEPYLPIRLDVTEIACGNRLTS